MLHSFWHFHIWRVFGYDDDFANRCQWCYNIVDFLRMFVCASLTRNIHSRQSVLLKYSARTIALNKTAKLQLHHWCLAVSHTLIERYSWIIGWYWLLIMLLCFFNSSHKKCICIMLWLSEFHSSLGHRNVWCLRCFWYLECWVHCNWVTHMCPTILWSPAYACTIPHCSGRLHTAVSSLLHVCEYYSDIWEYIVW